MKKKKDKAFKWLGKENHSEILGEVMLSLPKKLITVLLYYFFQLSDVEIGRLFDIPRSTIQYRLARYFL